MWAAQEAYASSSSAPSSSGFILMKQPARSACAASRSGSTAARVDELMAALLQTAAQGHSHACMPLIVALSACGRGKP